MTATGIGPLFDETLARVYRRATDLGLLGPREADHVIERSMAFVDALMRSNERDGLESGPPCATLVAPLRVADLGSGAGVPGLVVAVGLPGSSVDFVEISGRRCAFSGGRSGSLTSRASAWVPHQPHSLTGAP